MSKFYCFILTLFCAAGLVSCQMEGPVSDIPVHQYEDPKDELVSFSAILTDGIVKDGALAVIPQLVVTANGNFPNELYLSYNVDGGESVIKNPVETGRAVHYDLDSKVWSVGEHKVAGMLYSVSLSGKKTILKQFEGIFTITEEKEPVVEDDYLVSITRGSTVIPLHTTETAELAAGADCMLKIDFKDSSVGKVNIKNVDYDLTRLDFNLGEKFEGEGVATVPFSIKNTGEALITVTFTCDGKTYKPTFRILIVL